MRYRSIGVAAAAWALLAGTAAAQQPSFNIKLADASPAGEQCSVLFLVSNKLGVDITKARFEVLVFDVKDRFKGNYILPLPAINANKQKGIKFTLPAPAPACAQIKKLAWNGFKDCAGDKDMIDVCDKVVNLSSSVDTIAFNDLAD